MGTIKTQNQSLENFAKIMSQLPHEVSYADLSTTNPQTITELKFINLTIQSAKVIKQACIIIRKLQIEDEIESQVFIEIIKIPSLQELKVKVCNQLIIPENTLPSKLKTISIYNPKLGEQEMIALVKNLPLLEKISIGRSRNLTSKCILELAKLPNLKSLGFASIYFTSPEIFEALITSLNQIKELRLFFCNFSSVEYVKAIIELPMLQNLDLNCSSIPRDIIKFLIKGTPRLRCLKLFNCNIENEDVAFIIQNCKELSKISLSLHLINDQSLRLIAKCTTNLKELQLNTATGISYSGVSVLAQCCPNLILLDLKYCTNIQDRSIVAISSGLPLLQYLVLNSCGLTSKGVIYLRRLKLLQYLSITNNLLSQQTILKLLSSLSKVKKISFSYPHRLSNEFFVNKWAVSRCLAEQEYVMMI